MPPNMTLNPATGRLDRSEFYLARSEASFVGGRANGLRRDGHGRRTNVRDPTPSLLALEMGAAVSGGGQASVSQQRFALSKQADKRRRASKNRDRRAPSAQQQHLNAHRVYGSNMRSWPLAFRSSSPVRLQASKARELSMVSHRLIHGTFCAVGHSSLDIPTRGRGVAGRRVHQPAPPHQLGPPVPVA
jgi:hypothetical protein